MYIVTLTNNGEKFFLRGTTWAFARERANEFATEQAARDAITKAAKFMKSAMVKRAEVVAV